jgi:hypothetical protein
MPSLEEIMGSSYRADMTADEVVAHFKNQLLSGGEYVSKAKADAEKADSAKQIADLQNKLNGNLTDEQKREKEFEDLKAELEALRESGRLSKIETAKLKAQGALAEMRITLDIKEDDKEYKSFMENISGEDSAKTESISKYINKLVKDAYEKGKAESTKKNLGTMGKQYTAGSTDKEVSKDMALVEELKASKPKQKEFKKSNFIS